MNTPHDEVKRLAYGVSKDVKAGKASERTLEARLYLEDSPGAALVILDLLFRAANRKRPNEALVHAYLHMFGIALEFIRYQFERRYREADELLDMIREQIVLWAKGGLISGPVLMQLLNAFREAKLEPGDDLTSLLGEVISEEGQELDPAGPEDLQNALRSMVEEVGPNPFDLHGVFADLSHSLPSEFRKVLLELVASSPLDALRDMAILSLLDPSPEVRAHVCRTVEKLASPALVSPVALRRMIALRNWWPEAERPLLDGAIRTVRQKGGECASWTPGTIVDLLASPIDGAGAQSVFAVLKDGRKHVIAALLVKQGVGVADAWCLRDQSKSDVSRFLENVDDGLLVLPVTSEFVAMLVRHNLALGLNGGAVPPVGLLDFVEALGLAECRPDELGTGDLLDRLEGDIEPDSLTPEAVARTLELTGLWPSVVGFADSWFEDDSEVAELVHRNRKARRAAKVDLIVDRILEARRTKWADRFTWMALWAKHETERQGPWHEFAVLAREVHRGRPLKEIPIMAAIAEETLAVAAHR